MLPAKGAIEPSANGFRVTFLHDGQEHSVNWLSARGDAELVCDVLALKEALDAGLPLDGLQLHSQRVPLSIRPSAAARQVVASARFASVVQQLQAAALEMRRPMAGVAGMQFVHSLAFFASAAPAVQLAVQLDPSAASAQLSSHDTPLHVAARFGNVATMRVLLAAAPATARCLTIRGFSALHGAASAGHVQAVQLLLEAAPETAAVSVNGWCPLHAAAAGGRLEATQLLFAAAPETALMECRGRTPFEAALEHRRRHGPAAEWRYLAIARCLVGAGPASAVIQAILAQSPALQIEPEYADLLAARLPLSSAEWRLLPAHCSGLGRLLPAALAAGCEQARQLVGCMPELEAEALHAALLALARLQRRLGVALPPHVAGRIAALAAS